MFLAAKTSCYDDRPDSQTGEEGVSVEDALRYALCALRNFSSVVSISSLNLAPFAPLPLDFPRGPEVLEGREDLFFLPRPVFSCPAFAAYCHLPTVFLSGVADSSPHSALVTQY